MSRGRTVSLALFASVTWSCTGYVQIPPDQVGEYTQVRVSTDSGEEYALRHPSLRRDTIRGVVKETSRLGGDRWSDSVLAIPIQRVEAVQALQSDETANVWLVTGLVVLAGLCVAAAASGPF